MDEKLLNELLKSHADLLEICTSEYPESEYDGDYAAIGAALRLNEKLNKYFGGVKK